MITREADYSIRALYHLARPENLDCNVTVATLSECMEIPFRHLRRITLHLVQAGFVHSEKGRKGGCASTILQRQSTSTRSCM